MPLSLRFLAARRHARAVIGAACITGALAFAPPAPANSPPAIAATPVSVAPPITSWRAPTLQVQGAELAMRKVTNRSEIFPIFRDLFQRRPAQQKIAVWQDP